jgi:hypothetical protein
MLLDYGFCSPMDVAQLELGTGNGVIACGI